MSKRVNVRVFVECGFDGELIPAKIIWPDGREFIIDKVLDVRNAPAKSGGAGLRFLCRIQGREVPLYYGVKPNGRGSSWWCDGKD